MKLTFTTTIVFATVFSTGHAIGQDAAVKKELKKFAGTWRFESGKKDGKDLPKDAFEKAVWKFKGNIIQFTGPDGEVKKVKYKLDPTTKPPVIDFTILDKNKTIEGIYKFEKGKLIVCVTEGDSRPDEFVSNPKNGFILMVLRRSKK